MAEFINKEAAYDYATLDSWYIASVTNDSPVWTEEHLEELLNDFYVIPKDTPAADVAEVIRCKNCKNRPDIGTKTKGMVWCRKFRTEVHPNGYCSYGERRTDNV